MKKRILTGVSVLVAVGALLVLTGGIITNPTPSFVLMREGTRSGVHNLNPYLCINSICEAPVFRYVGGDADATDWDADGFGETLTAAGSGGSFNDGSPYVGPDDDSVHPEGTRYWSASGSSFANVGTDDFVIEALVTFPSVNGDRIFDKFDGSSQGYRLFRSGSNMYLQIGDGSTTTIRTSTIIANYWYLVHVFVDRSGSATFYMNATQTGPIASVSGVGDMDSTAVFTAGATAAGTNVANSNLAYLALYKRANWLDSHLQATLVEERLQYLSNLWPQIAHGTKKWTSYTRASVAYVDKWEGAARKMYLLGAGVPRIAHRKEKTSGADFYGYLVELVETNDLPYSDDLTNWTASNVTIDSDATSSPFHRVLADGIETASADGDVTHSITADLNFAVSNNMFVALVKAGAQDWVRIASQATGPTDVGTYFNLSTGLEGTSFGSPTDTGIEAWGDGWYSVWIYYSPLSGNHTHSLSPAEADGDYQYTGTDSVDLYAIGLNHFRGNRGNPDSFIPTNGAAATRSADVLYFKGDDGNIINNKVATLQATGLIPDMDRQNFAELISLSDGGSAAERVSILDTTGDARRTFANVSGSTEWLITGSTDVSDGDAHTSRVTYRPNRVDHYLDRVAEGTPDTSCDVPDDLDRIHIGTANSNTRQTRGLVNGVIIWPFTTIQIQ